MVVMASVCCNGYELVAIVRLVTCGCYGKVEHITVYQSASSPKQPKTSLCVKCVNHAT